MLAPLVASRSPDPRPRRFVVEACSLSAGRRSPDSLWSGYDGRSVLRSRPRAARCSRGTESRVRSRTIELHFWRGRSRSYIRGTLMKLIIVPLKSLLSLAAGGSAPGPPRTLSCVKLEGG